MIVSNNISPDKNLYYIGGEILNILINENGKMDLIVLYSKLNTVIKVNFVLFTYALDWLFISELIENDKKGAIIKCL